MKIDVEVPPWRPRGLLGPPCRSCEGLGDNHVVGCRAELGLVELVPVVVLGALLGAVVRDPR